MAKIAPNTNGQPQNDADKMKVDYFQPTTTLRDIAKKYKLSLSAVYHLAQKYGWAAEKKNANEIAFLESVAAYIKKRKDALLKDLDRIDGIEDKVFQRLKRLPVADIKVNDLVALIKCKYDLIAKYGTNKAIVEQNIQEGDTNINFNLSDTELDKKIIDITNDIQKNKRLKVLKAKNK